MKDCNRLKRFALFFVNEKGYFCLNELIKNGRAEQIGFVVTYRQKLVREDYFDKIVSLCSEHGIQYFERKAFNNVNAGELFQEYRIRGCIAVGWQFLLPTEWFKDLENRLIIFHDYIHSFRFAQAQNVMKIFSLSLFFFIILLVGNSVYYKSRGGEWAVRHAG